jgi:hypothetical protein
MTRRPLGKRKPLASVQELMRLSPDQARPRLRAALALAGIDLAQLAERLKDEPNLSHGTLANMSRGARGAARWEVEAIAAACGLHPSFFFADFSKPLDGGAEVSNEELAGAILDRIDQLDRDRALDVGRALERIGHVERTIEDFLARERGHLESLNALTQAFADLRGTTPPSPSTAPGTPPSTGNREAS